MTELPDGVIARAHRAIELLHTPVYFSPEADEELVGTGLRPGRMPYFASRSAAMGAVGAGTVAATFYNFNPVIVARVIPRAWTLATPEQVLAARLRGVDRTLRRLLGEETITSTELAEAAELGRIASSDLDGAARPLYSAHAELPWPDEPHLVLWHAATLLREHRGDGHLAALLAAELSGIEALVTYTVLGRSFNVASAKLLRGWSDEEWDAAIARLTDRGLMADGQLSEAGTALRARLEDETDRLAAEPYRRLGAERTARLTELAKQFSRTIAAGGAFPVELFG